MYELIYVVDTYCGWCYGFSATARALAEDPEITITVKHGSLFTGERSLPIRRYPHIPAANAKIAQLTHVEFGETYELVLAQGDLVMDSNDGALALMALRSVAGEDRGVECAARLQDAFYQQGLNPSEEKALLFVAEKLGLDSEAVLRAWKSPEIKEESRKEQEAVLSLGVNHYPTLIAVTEQGLVEVGAPTASASNIKNQLKQLVRD